MLVVSSLQSNTTYCTANETCVVACTVVVAPVTVMVKLPTGVERRLLPPQPASARRVIIPTTANNRRSFVFQLLRPPNAIVTSPRTGKANAAYKRRFGPPKNRVVSTLLALPDVVSVMVTCESGWLVAGGLNTQAAPTGKPLQPNDTMPRVGSSSSTSKTNVAEAPAFTAEVVLCGVITIGGPRLTGSLAVLLLGFTSPPPETVAVFVKLLVISCGIFTVMVITG